MAIIYQFISNKDRKIADLKGIKEYSIIVDMINKKFKRVDEQFKSVTCHSVDLFSITLSLDFVDIDDLIVIKIKFDYDEYIKDIVDMVLNNIIEAKKEYKINLS